MEAEVQHLQTQHARSIEFDNLGRETQAERTNLEARLATNHAEQSEQIRHAVEHFAEVSQHLYREPAELTITGGLTGPPIKIRVPRQESEGVSNMQIFCFDLTLMRVALDRKMGIDFLLHDSHIFDGVDVRQIRSGLEYVSTAAARHGFQYITMMNTDEADKLLQNGFDVTTFAIEPRLSDKPTGGLFGRQFGGDAPVVPARRRKR